MNNWYQRSRTVIQILRTEIALTNLQHFQARAMGDNFAKQSARVILSSLNASEMTPFKVIDFVVSVDQYQYEVLPIQHAH